MTFKPINGWTKEEMLDTIKARKFEETAEEGHSCRYLTNDGNKCAVGLFIPNGHPAQHEIMMVGELLKHYEDLRGIMPLEEMPMEMFQLSHDEERDSAIYFKPFNGNAKAAMIDWVEKYVEEI
jgi:hypothetical protein